MIVKFKDKEPDISKALYVAENATLIGDVKLEEGSTVWFGAVVRADHGLVHLGKNSNIQDNSVVHERVEIGENVSIGHNCIIHGCEIGDNTLVGMGSIIMNHVKVGKNCVIGAGSLLTERKEFPDNSLIMGSPAKVVKEVSEELLKESMINAETYIERGHIYSGK